MCEQPRGTMCVTEPGVLGLCSRMASSRMLIHKMAIRHVQESLAGMGNHDVAVTASLGAAPMLRAARNPQTMLSYIHPLLSYPGRVKIRVMLHALQFKVSCIHHVRACSMVQQGSALSPGSIVSHLFQQYFQTSFRRGHNLNTCSPLNHLGITHQTKHGQ